jgi:hypothetical protein
MICVGHVARMGAKRNMYGLLIGKPEGGPRCKRVNNIKMDLEETGWGCVD